MVELKRGWKLKAPKKTHTCGAGVRRSKLIKVSTDKYYEDYYPVILGSGGIGAANPSP